jgi:hypothetical protein
VRISVSERSAPVCPAPAWEFISMMRLRIDAARSFRSISVCPLRRVLTSIHENENKSNKKKIIIIETVDIVGAIC